MTSSSRSDTEERLNQALAGRYAIEREIGRGGMATVYLADDLRHGRKVALKVFVPEITSTVGPDRFLREIEIVARLNHPHILPLHDSGQAEGLLFYVIPYVRGQSLRQAIEAAKRLPVSDAVRIAGQVASALDHAHAQGLVHRDIKPENILLHEGEAMLMDFGIARSVGTSAEDALTQTGFIVGTPAYMSPEQAVNEPELDARSDVYALACLMYEMLAGEPPFKAPSVSAMLTRRLTDSPPSIRSVRPEVPAAVDEAIRKSLARSPSDRFSTAGEFATALTTGVTVPAQRTLAVLPFLNLSSDPENEYFADGMTEDVIAQLSKVASLKVISLTSVMHFKKREHGLREIAAQLNATVVLDGSVRRSGDRVRIVAKLIDAATDQHVWAETYDRRLTDIFAIQTDVALQIALALDAALSPEDRGRIRREPTRSLEAYRLYQQGRYCLLRYTEEGMRKGIEYFRRAVDLDPEYAAAYVGIAYGYVELIAIGAESVAVAHGEGRSAVDRALALDGDLAEAHCMLAQLKILSEFDWTGAEAEFKRAVALNPSSADSWDLYGRMCAALGRFDEAIVMNQRAHDLDPLAHRSDIATAFLRAGRYPEALQAARRGVELDPHYDRMRATLGWALFMNGSHDEGIAELEAAVALSSSGGTLWRAQLAQALAMAGRRDAALKILDDLLTRSRAQYVSPYHLAYVYAGLGEHDRAMDYLESAYDERTGAISSIKGSFLFAPLREHPRFVALLRRMNL